MKRILALILCLAMLPAALAESAFDAAELRRTENIYTFTHPGTVDTVVRLMNQPYIGQVDAPHEGELVLFIDYVTMPDHDATLIRLMASTVTYAPMAAEEIRMAMGGKTYTFTVGYEQSEYDGLYMEDYAFCLTETSLPFLKAAARQKQDAPVTVEFISGGEVIFAGQVVIPGEDAAAIYDRYIDLGGRKQDLHRLEDVWPCKVK